MNENNKNIFSDYNELPKTVFFTLYCHVYAFHEPLVSENL